MELDIVCQELCAIQDLNHFCVVECYLCGNTCEKVYETFLLLNVVISLTFFLCCNGFLIASFDRLSSLLKHFLFLTLHQFYFRNKEITENLLWNNETISTIISKLRNNSTNNQQGFQT